MIFRESGKKAETVPTLSVVGLDTMFGACDGIECFRDTLYFGKNGDWAEHDHLIQTDSINFASFGFAFVDDIDTTPEQKTGLRVGLRALKDAGIDIMKLSQQRIAVLYASASGNQPLSYQYGIDQLEDHLKQPVNELEEILVMAGIKGGIYDLSNFVSPLTAGIMLSEKILRTGKADLTVLVMVGLGEITGSIKAVEPQNSDLTTDGAGAVVLQTSQKAKKSKRKIYSQIQSLAVSDTSSTETNWQRIQQRVNKNLHDILEMTSTTINEIGVIEVSENGDGRCMDLSIQAITQPLQVGGFSQPTSAIGSVESSFGYLNNASEMASFQKMMLQLSERMICGSHPSVGFGDNVELHGTQLYIAKESRTWFEKKYQPSRMGLVSLIQPSGTCTHILLTESDRISDEYSPVTTRIAQVLIPICGDTQEELLGQLSFLKSSVHKSTDLAQLQQFWIRKWERRDQSAYTAVFLGGTSADLLREIQFADQGLLKAIERGSDWQTPGGSYFSPNPLGPDGKVAFVYPGAFNSQVNSGKDLFYSFPDLRHFSRRISERVGEVLCEERLYPRSQSQLTDGLQSQLNQKLMDDAIVMLSSGTALATLYTLVLKEIFGIQPEMSFGYSLGENSMMFACGVWNQGDDAMQRLEKSGLFRERISGKQMAVREFWQQDATEKTASTIWANYVLMGDAETLKEKIAATDQVYLTHINTPRQVVIGGFPEACEAFIAEQKLNSIKAPFNHALHCEPVQTEWNEFHHLHHWPVYEKPDHHLYTAAGYEISKVGTDEIADNIANALTNPLDFPRLINKVYDDGARIFIETGAGSNCSKWVDQTLKREEHISMAVNINGVSDGNAVLRTLAKCVSHRVPLTLDALYSTERLAQLAKVNG
ncbi:MAG: type I polyketide synthase [Anaerolineaceae bacterium]|nr:type I polyketide synthase [Anaerolineaceae bacterium]